MNYVERAPAKLNLFLAVEPRIVDGKHPLTSVFVTLGLHDTLTFSFEEGERLLSDAISLELVMSSDLEPFDGAVEDNLVMKAVRCFLDSFGALAVPAERLHIKLEKHIPLQAGLGGGSSDAAATLRALARCAGIDLRDPVLRKVARQLGSDVPFFLSGGCALMGGFGDEFLEAFPVPLLDIVLVKPAQGAPTAAVYVAFDASPVAPAVLSDPQLAALRGGIDAQGISSLLSNNLEPAAIKTVPVIAEIQQQLTASSDIMHAMVAGSGSTVFALCRNASTAQQLAQDIATQGHWIQATKSH